MNNKDFIHEPDDREIDMMLKYVPTYSEVNARNIKNKFEEKAKVKQRKFSFKKLALVGIAASMVLVTTLVYANILDLSKIYRIIFGENSEYVEQHIESIVGANDISPTNENRDKDESVQPIENAAAPAIQSEYDGIVIKLISAINDENVLRIFATVTDTKGDRLGESLDFSSWGLSQGYGGNVSVVDYNKDTKTATIMITSLGSDHTGNATLTINGFSVGRQYLENLPESKINIGELIKGHTPKIISQDEVCKRGGVSNDRELYEKSGLLKFDEISVPFENTGMFSISNMGFVNGCLHIQAKAVWSDTFFVDAPYINTKLINPEKGLVYEPISRIDFILDKKYAYEIYAKEPHDQYIEMIYDGITNPEQLNDLSLTIDYMISPKITEGKWEFSFMVPEKVTTEFNIDRELPINGEKLKIEKVSLSPLGITVHLPRNMSAEYNHRDLASVEYEDGTVVELTGASIHTYEDESTLIFGGQIIEIEKIKQIMINGEIINISK